MPTSIPISLYCVMPIGCLFEYFCVGNTSCKKVSLQNSSCRSYLCIHVMCIVIYSFHRGIRRWDLPIRMVHCYCQALCYVDFVNNVALCGTSIALHWYADFANRIETHWQHACLNTWKLTVSIWKILQI